MFFSLYFVKIFVKAPKVALAYVGLAIQVLSDFKDKYASDRKSTRQKDLVDKCIQNIIDLICIRYESVASDLLESVKKSKISFFKLFY